METTDAQLELWTIQEGISDINHRIGELEAERRRLEQLGHLAVARIVSSQVAIIT